MGFFSLEIEEKIEEVCKSMNGLRYVDKEKFVMISHQTGAQGPENVISQK